MRRHLFGPVDAAFADQNLAGLRRAGSCLTFGPAGADVPLLPSDDWAALLGRLPAGWRPELVALWLPYAHVPECLWSAPVPLVGLAADWNLLWHHYRRVLPRCELALTDVPGVEVLRRAGIGHARPANLFGLERAYLDEEWKEAERDIDVLFVGNLHPSVQRERLAWLGRLARLADRCRVVIATGVFGADYRALLRRARVAFNRSVRGECNRRAFEAAACGALLFQEAGNREVGDYFAAGRECVLYGEDDLEAMLEHYLAHEDERRALAAAGRARARQYGFEALWARALAAVEDEWDGLAGRMTRRPVPAAAAALLGRAGQALGGSADPGLGDDLARAQASGPAGAALCNARGLAAAVAGSAGGRVTAGAAGAAARHFRDALACDPRHAVAALNLVEALVGVEQTPLAVEGARRLLALLDREAPDPAVLEAGHFPPVFDLFRVEWERAAWANAGRPAAEAADKGRLLRWRLHTLLADLTGDPVHYHEAAMARPDLPSTRAALGCALGRGGRPAEAVGHLRAACAADPFDGAAARALSQALADTDDAAGARRLAAERRLLRKAAPGLVPGEPWFAGAPAAADLVSVVIPCCNEADGTRLCLESVLRHTRPPYELVLIDNGSTDETPALLGALGRRPGPARVEVVRNDANLGFPKACNQGLTRSGGRFVVFLNNDTVVTEGWLDGLVARAQRDPKVGLVGAVTNYAPDPQRVEIPYAGLDGLDVFAARRRREFAGQALRVERLSGFCLLATRAVLETVGGFDERFGLGFFEDDDLCVRVREAGFLLLVAQDVFVHHFGSRTFAGLGLDARRQLEDNFRLFRDKWGPERCAGYRLPGGDAPAAPTAPLPAATRAMTVSFCLIVKDEESNLADCLGPATGLADEVVVVDTGSTDRTKEIALAHGACVYDFPWCDSFSAARNECLKHASGDWIFWLDADDRLDQENVEKLRALFAGLKDENAAYVMKCVCDGEPGSGPTVVDHVRLFRNRPDVHWEHRVHEQILPAIRRSGGQVRWADAAVRHVGYRDPALRKKKLERDLRLLELERAELKDHPFTLFNLGSVYQELGRHAEAVPLLRLSLAKSHPPDSIVRKLYALLGHCLRCLGERQEALAACAGGLGHYPDDAELLFLDAVLREEAGDLPGAETALTRLLTSRPEAHFASVAAGLRGYKARGKLAEVLLKQGRPAEAEAQWRLGLREEPRSAVSWMGLGQLLLSQQRFDEALEIAGRLEALRGVEGDGTALRARVHLARGEFAEVKVLLGQLIEAAPKWPYPRVLLSHVLLQEGQDLDAAERALLDVLELDANNTEAQNNLGVLRRQRAAARDQAFVGEVALAQWYRSACETPSDINEHLPTLYALARECRHVTEMGTRTGVSTTALLYAQPDVLVCYDLRHYPEVERLRKLAGRTAFEFRREDVLMADIDDTDLLFIDTWHVYDQLRKELALHAGKVRKYVVLHDTTTFGEAGETVGHRGVWPAVEEFLAERTFRLKERFTNNNGLTVLERVGSVT